MFEVKQENNISSSFRQNIKHEYGDANTSKIIIPKQFVAGKRLKVFLFQILLFPAELSIS